MEWYRAKFSDYNADKISTRKIARFDNPQGHGCRRSYHPLAGGAQRARFRPEGSPPFADVASKEIVGPLTTAHFGNRGIRQMIDHTQGRSRGAASPAASDGIGAPGTRTCCREIEEGEAE